MGVLGSIPGRQYGSISHIRYMSDALFVRNFQNRSADVWDRGSRCIGQVLANSSGIEGGNCIIIYEFLVNGGIGKWGRRTLGFLFSDRKDRRGDPIKVMLQ
jgi:hypothetical protein